MTMLSRSHCFLGIAMATSIVMATSQWPLPNNTKIYQVEDGTVFHFVMYPTHKLFVQSNGKEIIANIPVPHNNACVNISCINVHNNSIYFENDRKIYQATFMTKTTTIEVVCVRHLSEGELNVKDLLYKRISGESVCIYRSHDVFENDAISVHIPPQLLVNGGLVANVHRGKALYVIGGDWNKPSVYELCDNVIAIEILGTMYSIFAQDSSPFVYIVQHTVVRHPQRGAPNWRSVLHVLDTKSMKLLPSLQIESLYIAGVHNGKITMFDAKTISTCQLPEGYYLNEERSNFEQDKNVKRVTYEKAHKSAKVKELEQKCDEYAVANEQMKQALREMEKKLDENETSKNQLVTEKEQLIDENEKMKKQLHDLNTGNKQEHQELIFENEAMKKQVMESKVWALASVRNSLKFEESENLSKQLIVIQLESGTNIYFDNAKPFELFAMTDGTRVNADLKLLEGEFDCSYRGKIGNYAYFSTIRGKVVRFFRASIDNGEIALEQINEMKTSEISLFKNQPMYYIEQSSEWIVYQYNENYNEVKGEHFDISGINLLSKYERHFHRGVLYLFRETSTAKIEKVNSKVVKVEGPLLDDMSFYTPSGSDFIYIINQEHNVLLILNTIDLNVSQQCYEPPAGSNNHSIVGIHEGILTMAFDGVWGRHLSTAKLI